MVDSPRSGCMFKRVEVDCGVMMLKGGEEVVII